MIYEVQTVPDFATLKALFELKEAEFTVYLTGSRFFGVAHQNSDWDFFVEQDVPDIKTWLEERGWEPVKESQNLAFVYKGDPNIAEVYEKGAVQLQLVRDLDVKQEAQRILRVDPDFLRLCHRSADRPYARDYLKHNSRLFWERAMQKAVQNIYEPPKDIEF